MTSDREAEPVALKFLEKGFQCFILRYSVEPVRFPAALLQLATALRQNGVPTELHILPSGPHGLSLATAETGVVQEACAGWPDWATRWLWDL